MGDKVKSTLTAGAPDLSPAELLHSQRTLARRLQAEIVVLESRYEMKSAELDVALARGEIRETAEIAAWIVAYRTLRGLADERQARAE